MYGLHYKYIAYCLEDNRFKHIIISFFLVHKPNHLQQVITMTVPYTFKFSTPDRPTSSSNGETTSISVTLENVRGRIPSAQASRLRTMMLEAHNDPNKIIAHACSYDGLSSRLVEEAGFPIIFLAGYAVASGFGLPDTGYIAMEDMCRKIQEVVRVTSIPVMADGDTGYGSPMNVKRTVECFAAAGAAGIMIEDQTWPKRRFPSSPGDHFTLSWLS